MEKICSEHKKGSIILPEEFKTWNQNKIINWISVEPKLSEIDLRDYYWISRDKLSSMQSNLLVSPIVNSLLLKLGDEMPTKLTKKMINEDIKALSANDQMTYYYQLKQRIIKSPENKRNYDIFNSSLEEGVDCKSIYLEAIEGVGNKLPPSVIESLKRFKVTHTEFNIFIEKPHKLKK
jgi:hypothetical protein